MSYQVTRLEKRVEELEKENKRLVEKCVLIKNRKNYEIRSLDKQNKNLTEKLKMKINVVEEKMMIMYKEEVDKIELENKILKEEVKEKTKMEKQMETMQKQIEFLLKLATTNTASNQKTAINSKNTTESIMGKKLIKLKSDIEEHI